MVLSTLSAFHRRSAQSAALLLLSSDELTSCAVGTNGCLDLRFRAFSGDRWVEQMSRHGRNEFRWRPEQEASFAPPCSNLRFSEANVLYWRKYLQHCWGFSAPFAVIRRPHSDSAPGEWCLLCPLLVTPLCPGSVTWRARDNVALLRRSSAGSMTARII